MVKVRITEVDVFGIREYICETAGVNPETRCLVMNKVTRIDGCCKNIDQYMIPVHIIRRVSIEPAE